MTEEELAELYEPHFSNALDAIEVLFAVIGDDKEAEKKAIEILRGLL